MNAPVALFVYNRPEHATRTLEALRANDLTLDTDLFVFADGPKSAAGAAQVSAVRSIARAITGFKSVTLIERDRNFGLANSIVDGVSRLCDQFGRTIVLEDDVITSRKFLEYMNRALDLYENSERVMHISGFMFPTVRDLAPPDTFFYRATTCWGWATWKRAWQKFESDPKRLYDAIIERKLAFEFDVRGSMGFTEMLRQQIQGTVDSWAVRWYASVFLNGGLCLHPVRSLTQNAGMDGSGVHCGTTSAYEVGKLDFRPELGSPLPVIEESRQALDAIVEFNRSLKGSFVNRVASKLLRAAKRFKERA